MENASQQAGTAEAVAGLDLAALPKIGTVDERFQSYNVEMAELTGGNFWKPYDQIGKPTPPPPAGAPNQRSTPAGMDAKLYQYLPPIDLTQARLRKLAAALGPAYVRCSGTWANSTYLPDTDQTPKDPPAGYSAVLSRQQWKGLVDFAKATNAEIVTSCATSPGTRDAKGVWTPVQLTRVLAYTKQLGGRIAGLEFMNEPTFAAMGGAPKGYDGAAYGRDFKVFRPFIKQQSPTTLILGPGSVGEAVGGQGVAYGGMELLPTPDLLKAVGPGMVDAFSYHHYGAASQRCGDMAPVKEDSVLSEEWLSRTDRTLAFYRQQRDKYEPGKPFWNTETADAACGGNPWGAQFLDTFRYLDQMGRLAKQGVKVIMHNTLATSDYGLLDGKTLLPRPNYWGGLLWHQLMGTTVLDAGTSQPGLHLYAHDMKGHAGGVTLLVINNSRTATTSLNLPKDAQRYTLSAAKLASGTVQLNGQELKLGAGDTLPPLTGTAIAAGKIDFAPATITFLTIADAGNKN
jgi:hypothetical protein